MSDDADTITLATELTIAWLANPNTRVSTDDVPAFLASVHQALGKLSGPAAEQAPDQPASNHTPAVSVRKSLASPDRIISMIDGKPYASLKRHLAAHGLTPDEYRQRYGLKPDYPMVASGYSAARSEMSKRHNFGRKSEPSAAEAPQKQPETAAPAAPEQVEASPSAEQKPKAAGRRRLGISGAKTAAKAHLGGAEDA